MANNTGGDVTAKFSADTGEFSAGINAIKVSLNSLNASLVENKQKTKETNDEIKNLNKRKTELENIFKNGMGTAETEKELKGVNKELKIFAQRASELKTDEQLLKVQISDANKELKEQYKSLHDTGEKALSLGDIIKANIISDAIINGLKTIKNGFKEIILDSSSAAAEISLMSDKIGLSTEEIQKYNYAAKIIGLSSDILTSSMKQLMQAMSSARLGNKQFLDTFDLLGIEIVDTNGELRDLYSVYGEITDKLKTMTNETEQSALAYKIFGMQGLELKTMLSGGAEKIEEIGDKAKELGLILSESQIDNLKGLNEKIELTKSNFSQLSMVVAEEFSHSFDEGFDAAEEFVEFIISLKNDGTLESVAEDMAAGFKIVVNFMKTAIVTGIQHKDTIIAIVAAMGAWKATMSISTLITSVVNAVKSLSTANNAAAASQTALNTAMKANPYVLVASALSTLVAANIAYNISAKRIENTIAENARLSRNEYREEYEELKRITDEYENLGNKTNLTADEKDRLSEIQEILNNKYVTEANTIDLVNGKYEKQLSTLKELSESKLNDEKRNAGIALGESSAEFNKIEKSRFWIPKADTKEYKDFIQRLKDEIQDIHFGTATDKEDTSLFYFSGNAEEQLKASKAIIDYLLITGNQYSKSFEQAYNSMDKYQAVFDNYVSDNEYYNEIQNHFSETLSESSNVIDEATKKFAALSEASEENRKSTSSFVSEMKALSDAFAESNENGSLSLDTQMSLIDKGYAAYLSLNEETGAVTLTAEAYRDLAAAQREVINEGYQTHLADLKAARNELQGEIVRNTSSMNYSNRAEMQKLNAELSEMVSEFDKKISETEALANVNNAAYNSISPEISKYQKQFVSEANERIKLINNELSAKEKAKNAAIKAIYDEIEARKRLKEDINHQDEIDKINARLKYEQLDELSRKELERQKQELEAEREELEWQRTKTDEKENIETQYAAEKDNLSEMLIQIKDAVATVNAWASDLQKGVTNISNVVNNSNTTSTITTNPTFNFSDVKMTTNQFIQLLKKTMYEETY